MEQTSPATIDTNAHTVTIEVAKGTDVSNLAPSIILSAGATVNPASGVAQNFNGLFTYTVTAEDGETAQDWVVTVTEALISYLNVTSSSPLVDAADVNIDAII